MPSSAANGPHGFGVIHTCSIGVLPALLVPGGHVPSSDVSPATIFCCGLFVRQRLRCTCHWVSDPPTSGTCANVLPNGSMYIAATACCSPFLTSYTTDSGRN